MKTKALVIPVVFLILISCNHKVTDHFERSEFASVTQVDSGKAVAVMLTAYSTTLLANGQDSTILRVAVVDSTGREIISADDEFRVYINGDAVVTDQAKKNVLRMDIDSTGAGYYKGKLENGLSFLVLRPGTTPDKIKVEVRSENLWPASHEIHTIPHDIVLLSPEQEEINTVEKSIDRMIGADISFLPQFEHRGRRYYENGIEKDAVQIMAGHGFNYIRLRIFVHPENENGYSPGYGFCGLDYTLKMAERITNAGMKLLINFHYSDYWADPQQQNKPAAWAELPFAALKDTLRNYTSSVLEALKEQGTPASMVQVGNEINHGMLWPDGHISNPDQLAELLIAGIEGVRAVDENVPVMMHVALGGQNKEAVFWFDNMISRGVDFDIIGISYYPRWHGTLDDLQYNLTDLVGRYNKPVNVVEYSDFREQVHQIVFNLPDDMGRGTCIWEPIGSRGDLFDRDGNVIDGMLLYDKLNAKYLR